MMTLIPVSRAVGQSCPGILPSFKWEPQGTSIVFVNITQDPLGLIDSVNWDIGGFYLASDQDTLSYQFSTTASHTVTMHVWAVDAQCHFTVDALVAHGDWNDSCIADIAPAFTWYQPSNNVVDFASATSYSGMSLSAEVWEFGDGSPLLPGSYPTHAFALPGRYEVALSGAGQDTSTLDGCVAGIVKTVLVDGNASSCDTALFVDISLSPVGVNTVLAESSVQPLTTSLTADSLVWSFGDLSVLVEDLSSTSHVYDYFGTYQICLEVHATYAGVYDSCSVLVCRTYNGELLGAVDNPAPTALRVWPVPFSGELHLGLEGQTGSPWDISITDLTGRWVYAAQHDPGAWVSLDLSALCTGTYVIHATTVEQRYTAVVIKQ